MEGKIILRECDDPINPKWNDVAVLEKREAGLHLSPVNNSPVLITLKEWFRDGITDIVESETGELVLKKTLPGDDNFLEVLEDKLGANFQIVR